MKKLPLGLATLFLAACSTVPLGSIPKLARIDFMTTDLARMRIAIALPMALAPKPDGVVMELKFQAGQELEKRENLLLVQSQTSVDRIGLPTDAGTGQALYVFKLSQADVQKLGELRTSVSAAKARHEKGSLGLGIAAKEFCKLGDLPDGPALTTSYVLTSENDGYVTMSRDFNLRSDAKTAEGLAKLEKCQ